VTGRLVPIVLGVSGGLLVLSIASFAPRGRAAETSERPQAAAVSKPNSAREGADHQERLAQRLSFLERRLAALQQSPGAQGDEATEANPVVREEQIRQEEAAFQQSWQRRLEAFDSETEDPQWADAASESFAKELAHVDSAMGLTPAEVLSIECRSRHCRSSLRWPTIHDARLGFQAYISYEYSINCERHFRLNPEFLAEEGEVTGQVIGTLVFDCKDARTVR
jgi:hypothetical protein